MTKLMCMCSVSYTNSLHGVDKFDLDKASCQCRSREIGSLSVCQSVSQLVSLNTVCNNNFLKTNKALQRKHLI